VFPAGTRNRRLSSLAVTLVAPLEEEFCCRDDRRGHYDRVHGYPAERMGALAGVLAVSCTSTAKAGRASSVPVAICDLQPLLWLAAAIALSAASTR
jgi:hypothetical protein